MRDLNSKIDGGDFADWVVPTYASLLARKLVLPSTSSAYFKVDEHFFSFYFAQIISHVHFDIEWYVTKYPDIWEAIENGLIASAWNHYIHCGFYEHRLPYKIEVDEAWYLKMHPDVQAAVESQQVASAQVHFEVAGFSEGRLPYPNFTLRKSVGMTLALQQTGNFPPPLPVIAVRPPSAVRTSSRAGHGTASGLSLSAWAGTCGETGRLSQAAGKCLAWVMAGAAVAALGFGLTTDVSYSKVSYATVTTIIAPAPPAVTIPRPVDTSAGTDNAEAGARTDLAPRHSDSTGTESNYDKRMFVNEPRREVQAEGITPHLQAKSELGQTALSEPPGPTLPPAPTPDLAERPTVWVPYANATKTNTELPGANQVLPPTSSTEGEHNAQRDVASPQAESMEIPDKGAPAASLAALPADATRPPDGGKLLERGNAMLILRDIPTARELYKRAVAAGSGQAAMALGKTYDPRFLATSEAIDAQANPILATIWYRLAVRLGASEAANLLQQ